MLITDLKNNIIRLIKIHPLTLIFLIVFLGVSSLIASSDSIKTLISIYVETEPTAFATLLLAFVTSMAILRESISKTFNRPLIDILPTKIMEYPDDKNQEVYVYAAQPSNGGNPAHIWIRLYVKNLGRSPAKDVYVKIVSVTRSAIMSDRSEDVKLMPFNPFKLRWVSLDKSTEILVPWYGSSIRGITVQKTVDGNLVKNEAEYVNLCTFVGKFHNSDQKLCLRPVLVPGLPESDGHGNTVGEGNVAGMNHDILKVNSKIDENGKFTWEPLQIKLDLIIGGSNFRTRERSYMVKCSISDTVPPSTNAGNYSIYASLHDKVKISIELIK